MSPMMTFLKYILVNTLVKAWGTTEHRNVHFGCVLVADLFIVICDAVSLVYAGIAPANHA